MGNKAAHVETVKRPFVWRVDAMTSEREDNLE